MGELFGFERDDAYRARCERLKSNGVALWDVLQACEREGSLDSNIQMSTAEPNDFQTFMTEHSRIRRIYFNGQKASDLFQRLVLPQLSQTDDSMNMLVLPSTSPANAQLTYEQKLSRWKAIKEGP